MTTELGPAWHTSTSPTASITLHQDPAGQTWTRLQFDLRFRSTRALTTEVFRCLERLENPTVTGWAPLEHWDPDDGLFDYPTGPVVLLADLLEHHRSLRRPMGVRAALDLAYQVTRILEEATPFAEALDIPGHGNVSPWRIALTPDGRALLLGYSLPQVDIAQFLVDDTVAVPPESWRYCPPERAEGEPEDILSDLFSLALCVYECILGEPLHSGHTTDSVREAARNGSVVNHLWAHVSDLGEDVTRLLAGALKHDWDERYHEPLEFLHAIDATRRLPQITGRSLAELVGAVLPSPPEPPAKAPEPTTTERTEPGRQRWHLPAERQAKHHERDVERSSSRSRKRTKKSRSRRDHNAMFPRTRLARRVAFEVLTPDEDQHIARLSPDESLACSAARLIDHLCATPIDLLGHLTGWYRIAQGRETWYGDETTDVLDPSKPIRLQFIENTAVSVRLTIELEEPTTLDLEVGRAVHAHFMVSWIREQLELEERDWRLFAEDARPMDPWQVLDDYEPEPGFELTLRRTRSSRRTRAR